MPWPIVLGSNPKENTRKQIVTSVQTCLDMGAKIVKIPPRFFGRQPRPRTCHELGSGLAIGHHIETTILASLVLTTGTLRGRLSP
jgi:hypothetical protein